MSTSHVSAPPSTSPLHQSLLAIEDGVAQLLVVDPDRLDMLKAEEEVRALFAAAERDALTALLQHLDEDVPEVIIDGVTHKRAVRSGADYMTAAGKIRLERTLYRAAGERAVAVVDVRAGILDGWLTPRAAKLACFVVQETTPANAAEMFARLGGMVLSRASLDRLPKSVSAMWEEHRADYEAALRRQVVVPEEAVTIAVSLDGVMVPMKGSVRREKRERARAQGRPPSGPSGFKEVACGTVSFYDADGQRLGTRRMARMPEAGKTTLKEILTAEVITMLSLHPSLQLVKVADGAKDNWTFLSQKLPDGEEVLDFYHAVEHLSRGLAAAYGESSTVYQRQHRRLRHKLRDEPNGVERVIRSLRYLRDRHPTKVAIEQELKYFRNNRHRMSYATLTARNLPIGSGVIEAACKTLATTRMKRSGQRWRHQGGQAILTLRGWQQSGDFDRAWDLLHKHRVGSVEMPYNVVPLRPQTGPKRASV